MAWFVVAAASAAVAMPLAIWWYWRVDRGQSAPRWVRPVMAVLGAVMVIAGIGLLLGGTR